MDSAHYAAFVALLAQRYGDQLAAIEVWNEPDQANEHYFAGPEKPQRYAAILRAAYPAIKQAAPSVPVLGGSLVGSNGLFLRALYAAGIKGYYDGLAVHFYNLVARLAALDPRSPAGQRRQHAAVAQRVRLEQLLAGTQDPAGTGLRDPAGAGAEPRRHVRALARTPYVGRGGRVQAAGASQPKNSGC